RNPDGALEGTGVTADGTIPGPEIRAREGDLLRDDPLARPARGCSSTATTSTTSKPAWRGSSSTRRS
ncbi:MAG TPA: hypothetical protein VL049_13840, partial [Candidatus Dormibacteraeota bacterium]|nr:hypothetical protein [Candidatus Dormibacteraeota bacterium]